MEEKRAETMAESGKTVRPCRNAAQTKERILRSAERLFAGHPYELVTLRQIAAMAEINVALIVRYYGSKRELFGAVLDSLSAGRPPLRREDMLGDLADRMVRSCENRYEDNGELSILNILMLSSQSLEARPVIQERMKDFFIDLAAVEGECAVPSGFMLTSCIMGMLMMRRLLPGDYQPAVSASDVLRALQTLHDSLDSHDRKA